MAGIEKICEYSGEYPGGDMYKYKRNHIQVIPKYRKEFRNKDHLLVVFKGKKNWLVKRGKLKYVRSYDPEVIKYYPDMNYKTVKDYEEDEDLRVVYEYTFILYVPALPGYFSNGEYLNHTYSLSDTKRRLKRMLRCKKLNIFKINKRHDELENFELDNLLQDVFDLYKLTQK